MINIEIIYNFVINYMRNDILTELTEKIHKTSSVNDLSVIADETFLFKFLKNKSQTYKVSAIWQEKRKNYRF